MKKGHEACDYLRVWTVKFAERFSAYTWSSKSVAARSVDEALRLARALERKESGRISLKVESVARGEVLDG